jgi:hypothetical protein
MPALVSYQLVNGEGSGETTTERGMIECRARECLIAGSDKGLDKTVIEIRYNVVRSNVPHEVTMVRKLRDYLPRGGRSDCESDSIDGPESMC